MVAESRAPAVLQANAPLDGQIAALEALLERLSAVATYADKVWEAVFVYLLQHSGVQEWNGMQGWPLDCLGCQLTGALLPSLPVQIEVLQREPGVNVFFETRWVRCRHTASNVLVFAVVVVVYSNVAGTLQDGCCCCASPWQGHAPGLPFDPPPHPPDPTHPTRREGATVRRQLGQLSPKEAYALVCLPAIGQAHVLGLIPTGIVLNDAFERLAAALARVEDFYDSIGGLVGYQLQCLRLIHDQAALEPWPGGDAAAGSTASSGSGNLSSSTSGCEECASSAVDGETEYLVPSGLDLASADPQQAQQARAATAAGISALPYMAEIYPLGGAGDRLGLACEETGESLPTAVLQYCGRSLLENLVRDLQVGGWVSWVGEWQGGCAGRAALPAPPRPAAESANSVACSRSCFSSPCRPASTCTGTCMASS